MSNGSLIVIGGGIVGLATAHRFRERFPGKKVVVLEKEARVGAHQTGHNSGVLHSGIYYKPDSLKALNCIRGKAWMEAFCEREEIPFERCGKVIVAVDASEVPRLEAIAERGRASGIDCDLVGPERLRDLEPSAAGIRALHVPGTGIVDYTVVCERLAQRLVEGGGRVLTGVRALSAAPRTGEVMVETTEGEFNASIAVNCAGLHSDRMLQRSGGARPARIVPFRGEYYELAASARSLVRNLIYPVPDPSFPFLGVHFTRMIGGAVECGPNAVLAFAREGYSKASVNPGDVWDVVSYGGFWKLAAKHGRTGAGEMWRSLSKQAFVRALQRLVPSVQAKDLSPAPAGVRAQALAPDGTLVDDFLIQVEGRLVHVLNAPSPAATSSLSIGEAIVDRISAGLA
jgi:(S)-2-hydroxyglutarate dehydrogenase